MPTRWLLRLLPRKRMRLTTSLLAGMAMLLSATFCAGVQPAKPPAARNRALQRPDQLSARPRSEKAISSGQVRVRSGQVSLRQRIFLHTRMGLGLLEQRTLAVMQSLTSVFSHARELLCDRLSTSPTRALCSEGRIGAVARVSRLKRLGNVG